MDFGSWSYRCVLLKVGMYGERASNHIQPVALPVFSWPAIHVPAAGEVLLIRAQ